METGRGRCGGVKDRVSPKHDRELTLGRGLIALGLNPQEQLMFPRNVLQEGVGGWAVGIEGARCSLETSALNHPAEVETRRRDEVGRIHCRKSRPAWAMFRGSAA